MEAQQLNHRYPGMKPFKSGDKNIFFGRIKEIDGLYQRIYQDPITVLYSKSGLGKTSLLNAGLIPKLQQEGSFYPIYIRFGLINMQEGLAQLMPFPLEMVKGLFPTVLGDNSMLAEIVPEEDSLWSRAKEIQFQKDSNPYLALIFDQFEEFFSFSKKEREFLLKELEELLTGEVPQRVKEMINILIAFKKYDLEPHQEEMLHQRLRVKLVFTIRSDKLHQMDQLKKHFPSIMQNMMELKALDRLDAREAIVRPAAQSGKFITPPFSFEEDAITTILDFLKDEEDRVESSQLQIVCQSFEKKVELTDIRSFKKEDVGSLSLMIKHFYRDKIDALSTEEYRNSAIELIEKWMIDEENRRRLPLHQDQILNKICVPEPLLNELVNCHLLIGEETSNGLIYQLSHDTLVEPILETKQSRTEENLKAIIKKERKEKVELQKKVKDFEEQQQKELVELNLLLGNNVRDAYSYLRRANLYLHQNKYKEAEADYNEAIKWDPNYHLAYFNRGLLYYELKDYESAIKDLEDSMKLDANFSPTYTILGRCFKEIGQIDKAMSMFNTALKMTPKDIATLLSRAKLHNQLEQYDQALSDYNKIIGLTSTDATAYYLRAKLFQKMDQMELAQKDFEKAMDLNPNFEEVYYEQGVFFFNEQQYKNAVDRFDKMLELSPKEKLAFYYRGMSHFQLESYSQAVADLSQALDLLDKDESYDKEKASAFYKARAQVFHDLLDFDREIEDLNRAVSLQPDDAIALYNLAVLKMKTDEIEGAKVNLDQVIQVDPNMAEAYLLRSSTYFQLGDIDSASRDLKHYLELKPEDTTAIFNLAIHHLNIKEFSLAREGFTKAAVLEPEKAIYYFHRGLAASELEDMQGAIDDFSKAIELSYDHSEAYYHRAYIYIQQERWELALTDLEMAISIDPGKAHYYQLKGQLLYNGMQKYGSSLEAYQKAEELEPNNEQVKEAINIIQSRLG